MIDTRHVVLAVHDVPEHAIYTVNKMRVAVFKDAAIYFHIKDIAQHCLLYYRKSDQESILECHWQALEKAMRASGAITNTQILPFETKRIGFFLRSDSALSLVDYLIHHSRSPFCLYCRQTFRNEWLIPTTIELAALARVAANPPTRKDEE